MQNVNDQTGKNSRLQKSSKSRKLMFEHDRWNGVYYRQGKKKLEKHLIGMIEDHMALIFYFLGIETEQTIGMPSRGGVFLIGSTFARKRSIRCCEAPTADCSSSISHVEATCASNHGAGFAPIYCGTFCLSFSPPFSSYCSTSPSPLNPLVFAKMIIDSLFINIVHI